MIKLLQGDCLELMKEIPDGFIDMILADLPYGITHNDWDKTIDNDRLWEQYRRVIKDNGAIVLFASGAFGASQILTAGSIYRYSLIWVKDYSTGFLNAKRMPLKAHEEIIVCYKHLPVYNPQMTHGQKRGKCSAGTVTSSNYGEYKKLPYNSTERYPTSVIKVVTNKNKKKIHPTQKPINLLEYLIRTYTNEGDVVLDNCMGSGSTGVACVRCGRDFIGMELQKEYYEIAKNQIENEEATK